VIAIDESTRAEPAARVAVRARATGGPVSAADRTATPKAATETRSASASAGPRANPAGEGRYYSRKDLDGMIAAQVASVH